MSVQEIAVNIVLNKETLEVIANVEAGKNLSKNFKSVDELMDNLNG